MGAKRPKSLVCIGLPACFIIYIYKYIVFSTFRCLNIYVFQDKMFDGFNPIISWNIYIFIFNKRQNG